MKTNKSILFCMLICFTALITVKGQEMRELNLAKSYFKELDSLCTLDHKKLWGINLYGPRMLVLPENRLIIANQQDTNKSLVEKDNLFIGHLPENINISNTSFDWGGKNWTMVRWDALSPNDKYSRDKLLIHESWHRNQHSIGFMPVISENTHLDEIQGDILLKLEFLALKNALLTEQPIDKTVHLKNALTIRKYRQILFPGNNENAFERHEGMAEYTGYKLCGIGESIISKVIAKQLELSMDRDGFANAFAYTTGPAYGFLFDKLKTDWIGDVKSGKNLTEIGFKIIKEEIPADTVLLKTEISRIINVYDAAEFIKRETKKFKQETSQMNEFRQKFRKGDQLIILNNALNFSFNPNEKLIPLDDAGVIYKTMRITGEWGILEVQNGILRSNNWQVFIVAAPKTANSGNITEPDYKLILKDGWKVVLVKEGKYTLKKF